MRHTHLGIGHVGGVEDGRDAQDLLSEVDAALGILGALVGIESLRDRGQHEESKGTVVVLE